MPPKKDDATSNEKLLRLFRTLMLDGRKHYQIDLAEQLQCSTQTVMRLAAVVESVIGENLIIDVENRKRYYQIKTLTRSRMPVEFEEVRYLSICRDLAAEMLPEPAKKRVDDTIFNLSMLLSDQAYANRECAQKPQFSFYSKGRIDYTPHYGTLEKLMQAKEEKRICLIRYKAYNKKEFKEHRFAPSGILSMNGALYLLGATVMEDFKAIRHHAHLAVHRIADVTLTDRKFSFTLPTPEPGSFGLPWHEPRTFRIRFTPEKAEYVRERIWADQQKMEDLEDGGLLLEITTRSTEELMSWVRSFGNGARLVGE